MNKTWVKVISAFEFYEPQLLKGRNLKQLRKELEWTGQVIVTLLPKFPQDKNKLFWKEGKEYFIDSLHTFFSLQESDELNFPPHSARHHLKICQLKTGSKSCHDRKIWQNDLILVFILPRGTLFALWKNSTSTWLYFAQEAQMFHQKSRKIASSSPIDTFW